MALHWPFGHLQPKLWAKEGPGVKLAVWLPTTKSQESTFSQHRLEECDTTLPWRVRHDVALKSATRRRLEECDTALESSRRELQHWFRFRLDPSLKRGVMAVQSFGSPSRTLSGLHFGSPNKMCHSDVASVVRCREYYMGEGGGFPRVRAVVSLVCPSARGKSQHQRVSRMLN